MIRLNNGESGLMCFFLPVKNMWSIMLDDCSWLLVVVKRCSCHGGFGHFFQLPFLVSSGCSACRLLSFCWESMGEPGDLIRYKVFTHNQLAVEAMNFHGVVGPTLFLALLDFTYVPVGLQKWCSDVMLSMLSKQYASILRSRKSDG